MEFVEFSSEDFSAKKWVNEALAPSLLPGANVDANLSTLILRLQLRAADLNKSLEETSRRTRQSVPSALVEVEKLSRQSAKLQEQIEAFDSNLTALELNTSASIRFLSELDATKHRMETCASGLQKAESLMRLLSDVDELFSTKTPPEIGEHIETMRESQESLRELSQFRDSGKTITKCQNRLEAAVRPLLMEAFANHDVAVSQECIKIFKQIDRTSELEQYYRSCRVKPLEEYWETFDPSDTSFTMWLPSFYDTVAAMLSEELKWAPFVFVDSEDVEGKLAVHVMLHFATPLEARLRSAAGMGAVQDLIRLYDITEDFATNLAGQLGASISAVSLRNTMLGAYRPYVAVLPLFEEMERTALQQQIRATVNIEPSSFLKTISDIREAVSPLFLALEASVERCALLGHASEGPAAVRVLGASSVEFIEHLFDVLKYLRRESKIDIQGDGKVALAGGAPATYEVFSHDWTYVQGALQVLQLVNEFSSKLNTFDRTVRQRLLSQKGHLFGEDSSMASSMGSDILSAMKCFHVQDKGKAKKLWAFFQQLSDVGYKVLPGPTQLFMSFDSSVQSFVFDTMFYFLRENLQGLPQFPSWTKEAEVSAAGLEVPTFSMTPLSYVSQIGEHLFTLPQQLEPYASVGANAGPQRAASPFPEADDAQAEPEASGGEEDDSTGFVYQWVSAVSRATMSLYLQKISQIKRLSPLGAKQLLTDIEYLFDVMSALGVPANDNLVTVKEFLEKPENELRAQLETVDAAHHKLASRVVEMRLG